jgi:WD40 repeat protein
MRRWCRHEKTWIAAGPLDVRSSAETIHHLIASLKAKGIEMSIDVFDKGALMYRLRSLVLCGVFLGIDAAPGRAEPAPEVIEKGKKATALVEVTTAQGEVNGSAFCIDRSGLFITNAHVVSEAASIKNPVRLVIDIGQKSQRSLPAKVLRVGDPSDLTRDLTLLKVEDAALTPLELGTEDRLRDTATVVTFGFPLGPDLIVRDETYPNVSVIVSRITSLRRDKGRLEGVQFDNQLNEGNSGGPVLDDAGRVIGVAVATIRGRALNLAIPVGRLAEFLKEPGLVFEPPPLAYQDRFQPVTWTIKVQPPLPSAPVPAMLSVVVTVDHDRGEPRIFVAKAQGGGTFKVTLTPAPRDPDRKVVLNARFPTGQSIEVEVKDFPVTVRGIKFMASDLRLLNGGLSPSAVPLRGTVIFGEILGLGKAKARVNNKVITVDLNNAAQINVRPLGDPAPVRILDVRVEAKQGPNVIASIHKRAEFSGVPEPPVVAERPGLNFVMIAPPGAPPRMNMPRPGPRVNTPPPGPRVNTPPPGPSDAGLVTVGGVLHVTGVPLGAGKAIRPPSVAMGEARIGLAPPPAVRSEVRRLFGHRNQVVDLVLSRDGRYLVSCDLAGVIRVWDPTSGATLHTLGGRQGGVAALAMSPDGRRVLSGGEDHVLRLWDIERGQLLREFQGHGDTIMAIAFTPDGRRCLSAGGERSHFQVGTDRDIWVRDLEDGRVIARWPGHSGIIDALAVSPDGKRVLSSSSDSTARLWDIETGRELRRFPGQSELDLHAIFSPDGRSAIVTSAGHLIRIFDVETGRELFQLRGHTAKVDSLAASPDGRFLVSGSWPERMFRIWDLTNGRALGEIALDGNPQLGIFTPDGRRIFWSFSDGTVREFVLPDSVFSPRQPDARGAGDPLVRTLDGTISDVAVGGGGRYLFLTLKDVHKLAIFDVNAADVIKSIPLPSDNVLVAAGAKTFFIAFPDQDLFQRWDLKTMTRQDTNLSSPIQGHLKGLAMGSDSEGPLLAVWSNDWNNKILESTRFSFLDPKALKVLKVLKVGPIEAGFQGSGRLSTSGGSVLLNMFSSVQERVHVRASAGGDLFGIWHTHVSPTGFQTLRVHEATLQGVYNHDTLDHLAPGPDGSSIYTGRGGVLNMRGKPVRGDALPPWSNPEITIPTPDPAYYLRVDGLFATPNPNPQGPGVTISVHSACDGTRLFTIGGVDEIRGSNPRNLPDTGDFTLEKRFHYVPAANLLISIPFTNDQLVVRRLDLRTSLDKVAKDYLLVTSSPQLYATADQPLNHQIEALSKAGGLRYTLTQGPEGLTVSPAGALSWTPPKSLAGDDPVTVIVTVSDASGQERFHRLRISID